MFKKIIKNKYFQLAVAFGIGCLVFRVFGPERIEIKKETEIVEVEKEVEKVVFKDKIVRVVQTVEKIVTERKVKRKETFPDGRVVEEEIYESNTQQLERVKAEEEERYQAKVVELEREYQKKVSESKTIINPKKATVSVLVLGDIQDFDAHIGVDADYQIGNMFNLPIVMGASYTNKGLMGIRLGVRF